jgi:hypothetical protein
VALPSKFRPIVLVKFEGNTNPKELLALYSTDMVAARANEKIMANRFPMALKGMFLSWLMHFSRESIRYWEELCTRFVRAFQGGFKRHGMLIQLHAIVKREGERLRDFMMWFSQVAHTIPKAEDAAIIGVFMMNMCDKKMREKLNMHPVRNTHELWALAGFYSLAEEGRLEPEDAAREAATGANPGSAATKRGGSRKRRHPQFLAAEPSAPAGAKKKTQSSEEVATVKPATKKWCHVHESDEHNAYIFLLHHQLCRGTEEKCFAEQEAGSAFENCFRCNPPCHHVKNCPVQPGLRAPATERGGNGGGGQG